jgi:ABC-type Co2+ transport system permease subunit
LTELKLVAYALVVEILRKYKMHIEPGVVNGAKIGLSYLTGAAAIAIGLKLLIQRMFNNTSVLLTAVRCLITTVFVFSFFEILPQYPLGVSEVHFIFGATLFLFFGAGATAFGLVAGLSLQGLLLAPSDLPQLYINISTLLFPLFAVSYISKKIIPANIAYTDLKYRHVISLTGIYQGGIILWVAFWCFYGQGFNQETFYNVGIFSLAYSTVIGIECLLDVGLLATLKSYKKRSLPSVFNQRLISAKD